MGRKRSVQSWDRRRWRGLIGSEPPADAAAYRSHLTETLSAIAGRALPEPEATAVIARFLKPSNEVETFPDATASLGAFLTRE